MQAYFQLLASCKSNTRHPLPPPPLTSPMVHMHKLVELLQQYDNAIHKPTLSVTFGLAFHLINVFATPL